jgi:hypothetical protein
MIIRGRAKLCNASCIHRFNPNLKQRQCYCLVEIQAKRPRDCQLNKSEWYFLPSITQRQLLILANINGEPL